MHRLSSRGSVVVVLRLVAPWHVASSWMGDWTCIPCPGPPTKPHPVYKSWDHHGTKAQWLFRCVSSQSFSLPIHGSWLRWHLPPCTGVYTASLLSAQTTWDLVSRAQMSLPGLRFIFSSHILVFQNSFTVTKHGCDPRIIFLLSFLHEDLSKHKDPGISCSHSLISPRLTGKPLEFSFV